MPDELLVKQVSDFRAKGVPKEVWKLRYHDYEQMRQVSAPMCECMCARECDMLCHAI
jgi:hypothetical protein